MINININSSLSKLTLLLNKYNLLFDDEVLLKISKAGDGNMNIVLRVKSNKRSFIFKQSRPYVQKFKEIQAPIERINVEYNFYKSINQIESQRNFPKIIGYVKDHFFMMLEDLGISDDFLDIYIKRKINKTSIIKLTRILKDIHLCNYDDSYPLNNELKKLNHQHIFVLPLMKNNGFSLNSVQPGLETLANTFINKENLKNKSLVIGEKYLKKGKTLLHGDFYPGSWMQNDNKIFVIDPEFSFVGDLEFDLGVFIAHIIIATQNKKYLNEIISYYSNSVNIDLVSNYAGIEIIRRLTGLAQLPTNLTLKEKEVLLKLSEHLLLK